MLNEAHSALSHRAGGQAAGHFQEKIKAKKRKLRTTEDTPWSQGRAYLLRSNTKVGERRGGKKGMIVTVKGRHPLDLFREY